MVESLEEATRRGKKDIPALLPKIKKIIYAPEWGKKFGYPLDKIQAADYYVEYDYGNGKSIYWLIEASDSNLHKNLKQLEASADFFNMNGINVDGYLIVIGTLTRMDHHRYKMEEGIQAPLKQIYERITYRDEKPKIFYGKPVFLIERRDFGRLKK